DDREHCAWTHGERHILQHRAAAVEGDRDVLELDMTGDHRGGHGPLAFLHFDWLVEDFRYAAQRHADGCEVCVHPHQRLQRRHHPHLQRHEGDEGADGDVATDDAHPAVHED